MQRNKPRGHNSCERKQKWHNLISSPGCPSRSSLQIWVSSSPVIWEGEKVGGRQWWTWGLNSVALSHDPFWQWCDIAFTATRNHRLSSIGPFYHSFPHASSANTCDVFFSQGIRKFVPRLFPHNGREDIKQTKSNWNDVISLGHVSRSFLSFRFLMKVLVGRTLAWEFLLRWQCHGTFSLLILMECNFCLLSPLTNMFCDC